MSIASIGISVGGLVAMEGVSYATHRWIMHGVGMRWHRSHHAPRRGAFEKNDAFPVLFSLIGGSVFLIAALTATEWMFSLGFGIAAYGVMYMLVHEVYIHRRLPCPVDDRRVLDWLRDSHELHHLYGGEPYGMLFPVVATDLRHRVAQRRPDDDRVLGSPRRDTIRRARRRL